MTALAGLMAGGLLATLTRQATAAPGATGGAIDGVGSVSPAVAQRAHEIEAYGRRALTCEFQALAASTRDLSEASLRVYHQAGELTGVLRGNA